MIYSVMDKSLLISLTEWSWSSHLACTACKDGQVLSDVESNYNCVGPLMSLSAHSQFGEQLIMMTIH